MQFALEFVLLGMAFVFRKHRISPIASLIYGMPFLSMTMIVFNKEILQEFFSIARSTIEYFSNVDLNPKMMWSCYKKSHVQKLSNQAPQNFKTVKTDISLDSIVKQVENYSKKSSTFSDASVDEVLCHINELSSKVHFSENQRKINLTDGQVFKCKQPVVDLNEIDIFDKSLSLKSEAWVSSKTQLSESRFRGSKYNHNLPKHQVNPVKRGLVPRSPTTERSFGHSISPIEHHMTRYATKSSEQNTMRVQCQIECEISELPNVPK